MIQFEVGDRVVAMCIDPDDGVREGMFGTVCAVRDWCGDIGVQWDEFSPRFHNCEGDSEEHHGWYVPPGVIELAENNALGELPVCPGDLIAALL